MFDEVAGQKSSQDRIYLLRDEIIKEADQKSQLMVTEAKTDAEKILSQSKTEVEKIKAQFLEKGRIPAEVEAKRILATASLELKLIMAEKKEEILDSIFQNALDTITRLSESSDYVSILERVIIEGAIALNGGELEVFVRAEDISKINSDKLAQMVAKEGVTANFKINQIDRDSIGGALIFKEGKIWVDNTFEARLERRREDIRTSVAEVLFGRKGKD
ncbi:MAG: V-type ATP synthase subunit E [Candidatus Hodarchaeota archaeon]